MITNNFTVDPVPRPEYWVCKCGNRLLDEAYRMVKEDYPCPGCNLEKGKYWPWRMIGNYTAVFKENGNET